MVDEHNEPLNNYVWWEDMWTPYTPLIPIITAIVSSTVIVALSACINDLSIIDIIISWAKCVGIGTVLMGAFFAINWFSFSEKKEKEDDNEGKGKINDT